MAATDIKLSGLKRIVMSLMVGQILLAHFAARGVVVDRHTVYRDAQSRIAGQRRCAEGRGKDDRRTVFSRDRHLLVRSDNPGHLFMVRVGVGVNDRVAVGAGDGDARVEARVGNRLRDSGAVVVMGGCGGGGGDQH